MPVSKNQRTPQETIEVSPILPPQLADKIVMMLTQTNPYNQRENARNTLLLIRDELDRHLKKPMKNFRLMKG